ncbi:MurR/RpiR family transcriptional regulator [Alkalicoccus saliphilus]|jgi:DNA-binding MurR/RpiR family transcriptional regulator|uniref:MurR/RpiR family transcriptional regulator n=1 Tax=Alkalicoccus saliphilus TaxID=200989 RepID=A0A2T4U393_9BACI|nr:MurR/RpiR family transcriptional regulator [Alkalicoccus saliphilus]PTL37870.1 MurR/RpiR family transcriptional regulator [Alkalicoccus saliphilus]
MPEENDVFAKISRSQESLSKSHKKIAEYLIANRESAPFLTASRLAKKVEVGGATVVRFATGLGYKGYPDLQRHLQEALQRKLTSAEVLKKTTEGSGRSDQVLTEVLQDDMDNLQTTLGQIQPETFEAIVEDLVHADRIYIVAYRSAASIGSYLAFYLDLVLQNTELLQEADGVSEHLLDITENDVVLGLGFARYTKRTVEVMKYVQSRGANTIVMTDHLLSPLYPYGNKHMIAATEINSFIDSFAAPMSVSSALITALTRSEHEKVTKRLEELEGLWDTFDVFYDK